MFHSHSRRATMQRCRHWGKNALTFSLLTCALAFVGLQAGPVAAAAATVAGGCSWWIQYGLGGSDLLAPDSDAAYWMSTYLQFPGRGLVINGAFPQARYMSFTLYSGGSLVPGGALFDAEIQPSSGVNPFQTSASGAGDYTLTVAPGAAPARPAPNTLYTGTTAGAAFELMYRVYRSERSAGGWRSTAPDHRHDRRPADDSARTVHRLRVDGSADGTVPPTLSAGATGPAGAAVAAVAASATPEPAWQADSGGSDFPNPDNTYLEAAITPSDGQLVVLQAQMPTFPNTNAGEPPWQSGRQVRYWSICENDGPLATVTGCVPDFDAVENAGTATFVVSSTSNRPPNATAADGVNWLPWGAFPAGLLIYRQMLAAPTFQQAIADAIDAGSARIGDGAIPPADRLLLRGDVCRDRSHRLPRRRRPGGLSADEHISRRLGLNVRDHAAKPSGRKKSPRPASPCKDGP